MYTVITGALGLIGSGLVRHLNDEGKTDLILIDDLKKGEKWKNLVGKQFVDLISRHQGLEWLKSHSSEVDAIVHLGACSDTTETDGDYLLENNFRYTIRLAEWALSHRKRFIYASSAATYGDGALGFSDDEERLEELRPLNLYGFSKHLVDLWMKREKVLDQVVGLKYFNVFGPNEYHKGKMASMILKMADRVLQGESIRLYESNDLLHFSHGDQVRDFIYVKDAVKMTACFLTNRHVNGIFNIGKGEPVTWNALARSLFSCFEKEAAIEYIPMPKELSLQYQNYTRAEMGKFFKHFPLKITPIPLAVSDYAQNYLARQKRW